MWAARTRRLPSGGRRRSPRRGAAPIRAGGTRARAVLTLRPLRRAQRTWMRSGSPCQSRGAGGPSLRAPTPRLPGTGSNDGADPIPAPESARRRTRRPDRSGDRCRASRSTHFATWRRIRVCTALLSWPSSISASMRSSTAPRRSALAARSARGGCRGSVGISVLPSGLASLGQIGPRLADEVNGLSQADLPLARRALRSTRASVGV
jgi:hypothetical protein